MRRRRWVRGEFAAVGADGGGVLEEGRGLVESQISEARCGAPGWVALLTVTATVSGVWVEASDGRGEKASSGIGVVLKVRVERV